MRNSVEHLRRIQNAISKEEAGSETAEHERISSTSRSKTAKALEQVLRENRDEILTLAKQYGISNVRVFGSVILSAKGYYHTRLPLLRAASRAHTWAAWAR